MSLPIIPLSPAASSALPSMPPFPMAAATTANQPEIGRWVYAIGRLTPRFPDLGVEKEFAQAAGGVAVNELVGTDTLRQVLAQDQNSYLARQMCWVFTASDVEAFALIAAAPHEAARHVDALPTAEDADRTVHVVVGAAATADPGSACAAAGLPVVAVDHMLTFTVEEFLGALVTDVDDAEKDAARRAANDLFVRLTRRAANYGVSDQDRARNYAALRYSQLYQLVIDSQQAGSTLVGVDSIASKSPGSRRLVAIRLRFRNRRTDVTDQYRCLVDVTDRFPFLATSLTPVYD